MPPYKIHALILNYNMWCELAPPPQKDPKVHFSTPPLFYLLRRLLLQRAHTATFKKRLQLLTTRLQLLRTISFDAGKF